MCLDTMMLFKRVKCTRNVPVVGGSSIQQISWEEIRTQRLVGLLPKTIEIFAMTCDYIGKGLSKTDVGQIFTGLQRLRIECRSSLISIRMDARRGSETAEESGRGRRGLGRIAFAM